MSELKNLPHKFLSYGICFYCGADREVLYQNIYNEHINDFMNFNYFLIELWDKFYPCLIKEERIIKDIIE
jgi:hypothetical protein